ncbi:SpaA isopeptide-forming pilin-related protein [Pontibacillus litoralis]|uniref:Gram-positive cocci surface proteins LPxTG domain-containing protein n=1 Tax=Pontibacillus litoralis JSM 072002 TaxID=1385512 RepID=A0A0A5G0V0_9BACI|nr:SpaA isopeptide-forming pilin-related protein [Pontibacillus litoralis]KGX84743.1 hypothetical protein N784_12070 [Pontibacillus litoralis JSM 072002]
MRQSRTTSKTRKIRQVSKFRKFFTFCLIFALLLPNYGAFVAYGDKVIKSETPALNFQVEEGATTEKAVLAVTSDQPVLDSVVVQLPDGVTYSQEETTKLNQQHVTVEYNNEFHSVQINWIEEVEKQEATIILGNLQAENQFTAVGVMGGEKVTDTTTTFSVKVTPTTKVAQNDGATTEEKTAEPSTIVENTIENSTTQETSTEKTTTNMEPQDITPKVGDLNSDIDISPYRETVESGNAAMYKLVLKTTGSQHEVYENAKITVDLPITDYTEFIQDVNELAIAGVVPVYDRTNHTLVYQFTDELKAGQTYEKIVEADTKYGVSPAGASLEAIATLQTETKEFFDNAIVNINASSAVSVSKEYKQARLGGEVVKAPFPESFTIWDIKVSVPKKDVGQMYVQEGSKIIIQDTFSSGLKFHDVMNDTPQPTVTGNTLTWEFDAPTIQEQMQAEGEFFTVDLRVRLQVKNDNTLVGGTQKNNASAFITAIDGNTINAEANDSIPIISREQATDDIEGTIFYPAHFGPKDGKGSTATHDDKKDINPVVYDDAYLRFKHGVVSMHPGKDYDMQSYTAIYTIDPNLIFEDVKTPGSWLFARNNSEAVLKIPLSEDPVFNIEAKVNGVSKILVTNAKHNHVYTRSDLGLTDSDKVSQIILNFTKAPAGMFASKGNMAYYGFSVKPGYIGEVENKYDVRIKPNARANVPTDQHGNWWYTSHRNNTWNKLSSNRHATIAPKPTDQPPIAEVGVKLLNHESGVVVSGENRMEVTLSNNSSSTLTMNEPIESIVLLPPGVTLNSNPNPMFTDSGGGASAGQYKVLSDNYNGSGRQLVKISWDEDKIRIGHDVTAELDVTISGGAPNRLNFDVYGFSGDEVLQVPSVSGNSITNTTLQTDADDLNGDGVTDEPRLKSGNIYDMRGHYDLQPKKFVKGELDTEWNSFGQTVPGGTIDYKLNLTNTTGKDISTMTFIDVLPSVGDLGITDNVSRGSQFTPLMTGPITLPAEWKGKVSVYYSTAANPKRDDLIRHTEYPETTTPLSNPAGAEDPNWITEEEITDWSTIHSFKIELVDGETWIEGVDMDVLFSMKAPEVGDVDSSLLNKDIDPTKRAAWNSFAVATDYGQPVEPSQVGVYMNFEGALEVIKVDKESVTEGKTIFLPDAEFELRDAENKVVASGITGEEGKLTFDNLPLGNYQLVETKAPDGYHLSTEPIDVQITGDNPVVQLTVENTEILGSVKIVKTDQATGEVLSGAEFELRDAENKVVASGITGKEGKLTFDNLPLGNYQLVETKAPDGYRILTEPRDVEITANNTVVELTVKNTQNGYELPNTGGIGTIIFYGVGILLMVLALLLVFKRKKKVDE